MPDRKLIEAQVEFGMFPEAAHVTDVQESIIQDAVANRVQLGNLDEGRRKPKGPRPVKRVMQALGTKLRAKQAHDATLWQRACMAIADNDVDGANFHLSSEQSAILRDTYDKEGCAAVDFLVELEIDGKPHPVKVRTMYDYFMEPVKPTT